MINTNKHGWPEKTYPPLLIEDEHGKLCETVAYPNPLAALEGLSVVFQGPLKVSFRNEDGGHEEHTSQ